MITLILLLATPPEINKIVQIRAYAEDGRITGAYASPVASDRLLTAKHVSAGGYVAWEERNGTLGVAVQVYRHREKDLLMLRPVVATDNWMEDITAWVGRRFASPLSYARRRPDPGEEVYYVGNLPGAYAAVVVARVLGYDEDGDLQLDGWAHPGCSGSGVLNQRGELIGVISGVMNWASPSPDGLDLFGALEAIHKRALYKATVYAMDVVGGWPK